MILTSIVDLDRTLTRAVYAILLRHQLKASDLTVVHNDESQPWGAVGVTRDIHSIREYVVHFILYSFTMKMWSYMIILLMTSSEKCPQPYLDALSGLLDLREGFFRRVWVGTKAEQVMLFLLYLFYWDQTTQIEFFRLHFFFLLIRILQVFIHIIPYCLDNNTEKFAKKSVVSKCIFVLSLFCSRAAKICFCAAKLHVQQQLRHSRNKKMTHKYTLIQLLK